jgi:hypothetical protein
MNTDELIVLLNKLNVFLSEDNGNLVINAPKGVLSQEVKGLLSTNKPELIELITFNGMTKKQLQHFLGEDWHDYKDNPAALRSWADLLAKNRMIEQGIVPPNFSAVTRCKNCGDIFVPPSLINGGQVLSCPWCFNRYKNLPIPRPKY